MGAGASAAMVLMASQKAISIDQLGTKIYNEGINGQRACVECHLHSGQGMIEGDNIVLPINGKAIFSAYDGIPIVGRESVEHYNADLKAVQQYLVNKFGKPPARPAYTEKSLAKLFEHGIDSAGRKMAPLMPAYHFNKQELNALTLYLKKLDILVPVGVDEHKINFVTIISEEATQKESTSQFINKLQEFATMHNTRARKIIHDFRAIDYSFWVLKGPKETWRQQLEQKYSQKQPALIVSGIADDWTPIHNFSEEHHIPTLLPVTEQPSLEKSTYTFYWTRGQVAEGEIAGREAGPNAVVIGSETDVRVREVLAVNHQIKLNEPIDQFETVISFDTYDKLQPLLQSNKKLILSAALLGRDIHSFTAEQLSRIQIVYPYWIPQDADKKLSYRRPHFGEQPGVNADIVVDNRAVYKANTINHLLGDVLTRLRGNFTSNNIVDKISTVMVGGDMGVTDDSPYEHMSFSPAQRFIASNPQLVKVTSDGRIQSQ